MRNGNFSRLFLASSLSLPFYPTYEEWKHHFPTRLSITAFTFYPTYEEWKPDKIAANAITADNFLSYL